MDQSYTYTRVDFHKTIPSSIIAILRDIGAVYAALFLLGGLVVSKHTQASMNASIVRRAFDVQLIDDNELTKLLGAESLHKNHEELISESLQRQLIARQRLPFNTARMLVKSFTCGLIGKVKSVKEGRIASLFNRGLKLVRRDLDISNTVKSIRRTKSMANTLLSQK